MRFSDLILAASLCVVWRFDAASAKIGVTYIPPVFYTALRFVFVLNCLSPWLKAMRR